MKNIYYDGNDLLSHNCLFNFIIGNRSCGKTYWSKKHVIKNFLKNGSQFIYLRRYDTELTQRKKDVLFDDIKHEFQEHDIKVDGYQVLIDDKVAGMIKCLSKGDNEKSVPMPLVTTIIFDEFLIKNDGIHRYITDEVKKFLDFYFTVDRLRSTTRVFFVANAISQTNPYFMYWKIRLNGKRFIRSPEKDDILVEYVQNDNFKKMAKETRFGKLISGTDYEEYAIDNKFYMDDNTFIGKRTPKAKYHFTMVYRGVILGIWIDYTYGKYFVSNKYDRSCRLFYCFTTPDHKPNTLLIKNKQSKILKLFSDNYRLGNVLFEDINVKNITYDIMRLFLL